MSTMIVGSMDAKKGVLYNGLIPLGNAFRLDDGVRVSVNKNPFVYMPVNVDMYSHTAFSYVFEKDVGVVFTRVEEDNLVISFEASNSLNLNLLSGTESADIVTLNMAEAVVTGRLGCVAYIDHENNRDITMRLYKNSVEFATVVKTWVSTSADSIAYDEEILDLAVLDVITFTLEASNKDAELLGTIQPSRIQVNKIT